mgnify:FL=1
MICCPRCGSTDISPVGTTHYVCNNPTCVDEHGDRTQFQKIDDTVIQFPENIIFNGRNKSEFYKLPYLQLKNKRRE